MTWLIVIWGALIALWVAGERWALADRLKRLVRGVRLPARIDPGHPFDWSKD